MSAPVTTGSAHPCARPGPVIEARSVHRFFRAGDQETLALRDVSLTADPGELVVVSGPSGAGKSTLLACLAGLDEPDGGSVRIAGRPMSRRPERQRARLRARAVGMMFQSGNLIEHLTVERNVTLVQRLVGRVDAAGRRYRSALLETLGLARCVQAYPSQLSGGEAVRAALAVALANDPPVLLADEPTGELDTATEANVLELLRELTHRGVAILVASHSQAVAAAADRGIVLVDGRVSR